MFLLATYAPSVAAAKPSIKTLSTVANVSEKFPIVTSLNRENKTHTDDTTSPTTAKVNIPSLSPAEFLINGVRPVGCTLNGLPTEAFINDLSVPKVALSAYVYNNSADNMGINYLNDNNCQGYI